jgi:hypothetical protein
LFKRIGVIGRSESGRGFLCYLIKVLHEFIHFTEKKGGASLPFLHSYNQAPS